MEKGLSSGYFPARGTHRKGEEAGRAVRRVLARKGEKGRQGSSGWEITREFRCFPNKQQVRAATVTTSSGKESIKLLSVGATKGNHLLM
ncbi:hypothetical protein AMTR_s00076p00160700 [Amborella trichopoda]|uniref:Uncharacterized protein n=1 Tax=Amborella trichopoda TaxID=13333 RepID=W1P9V9_AMBTC|nr:hypothetical protein AMTR_s00076p00160700 [Amborella trichopoda]